jgi:hypothetical protein
MLAYGATYASALLCYTLSVSLAAVVSAFSAPGATAAAGVLARLPYAGGMGVVMAPSQRSSASSAAAHSPAPGPGAHLIGRVSALDVLAAAL